MNDLREFLKAYIDEVSILNFVNVLYLKIGFFTLWASRSCRIRSATGHLWQRIIAVCSVPRISGKLDL